MLRDLLRPPEADCPRCGANRTAWDEAAWSGRLPLLWGRLLARLTRRLWPLRCAGCGARFPHVHLLDRTVVGYHGCSRAFARDLLAGRVSVAQWQASQNDYDWLGAGVYFWEHAPGRAWQWARQRYGEEGAVVAAEIRLGRCLDLGDTAFTGLLRETYNDTVGWCRDNGVELPKNAGKDFKLRRLDRLILDRVARPLTHKVEFIIKPSDALSRKAIQFIRED